jgi:hypothetical protein
VISLTPSVANSSDDIVITALDAVHWTSSAWAAVTRSTINNTFQTAGFKSAVNQESTKTLVDSNNETDEETNADDVSSTLQTLDMFVSHVSVDGKSLSDSEFVEVDDETPAFNEWSDPGDPLIVVDDGFGNHRNEEELAATEQPQLHSLISRLDSQLTQVFIDSKVLKQTTIDDFFVKK